MTRFTRKHAINTNGKAEALGITNLPGTDVNINPILTSDYIYTNLDKLFTNCIIPIQDHFDANGTNIGITSAYRCSAYNAIIGGVKNSHHTHGYAADIIAINNTSAEIINWCIENLSEWNQLIWEFPEKGTFTNSNVNCSWVHISYIEGNNPRVISVASNLESLHNSYNDSDTLRRGTYTHYIKQADIDKLNDAKGIQTNQTY